MLIEQLYWKWNPTLKIEPINIGDRYNEISNMIQTDNSLSESENQHESFHLIGREKFHLKIKDGVVENIIVFDSFQLDEKELIKLDRDVVIELLDKRFERTDESNRTDFILWITLTDSFVRAIGITNKK